eukprot:CAMPEP_0170231442 /NCGR_PEP_ID=MMETSP0116_2-20130129/15456_1 /TAXON_ID=400756 /ORGANISM="Durinskia baltica, Strain CSIRO CS-38" /LENGTH=140 /DNA_ID=CAMNT_0010482215 /DNA_START=57 /DNA_END=480 /DNA_ORIENTATION=+
MIPVAATFTLSFLASFTVSACVSAAVFLPMLRRCSGATSAKGVEAQHHAFNSALFHAAIRGQPPAQPTAGEWNEWEDGDLWNASNLERSSSNLPAAPVLGPPAAGKRTLCSHGVRILVTLVVGVRVLRSAEAVNRFKEEL